MEKWVVVAAIWTMCAMCAVLFIRGATHQGKQCARKALGGASSRGARGGYEAHDA